MRSIYGESFNMHKNNVIEKICEIALFLFFSIFFVNLVIDDGINWSLNWILVGLLPIIIVLYKKINLPVTTILTFIIPFLTIYGVDCLFHANQLSNDHYFNTIASPEMMGNFFKILPLLALSSILYFLKKSESIFFSTLNLAIIVSIIFNSYFNLIYNFDRGLLITKFDAIILYDACLASLSILALVLNFNQRNKFSAFFIILSLINLFLIVGHGSRGTWLGIPLVLILISLFFFKTQKYHVLLTLVSSLILTTILLLIPHSPINNRVQAFKQDANLVEQNHYHSSVGNRVFLWNYAINQFETSPIIGVGTKKFRDNICIQQEKGLIPACNPHAHNIFFQFIATHGLFGLIGILTAFLLPFIFYVKSYVMEKKIFHKINHYSVIGIIFTLFFGICGLTDFLFFTSFPTMFYFLITITLMTFSRKKATRFNPIEPTM